MACDACGKMSDDLESLSDHIRKYLPYKYHGAKVCRSCERKLNDELDKQRNLAWVRCAELLVRMVESRKKKCSDCYRYEDCNWDVDANVCCEYGFSTLTWLKRHLGFTHA